MLEKSNNDVNKIREKYELFKKSNVARDLMGWVIDAIQKDYQEYPANKRANWNCTTREDPDYFTRLEEELLEN